MPASIHSPPVTEIPIYWFVRLEQAVEDGDFVAAAAAQLELSRLGVFVKYRHPNCQSNAEHAATTPAESTKKNMLGDG